MKKRLSVGLGFGLVSVAIAGCPIDDAHVGTPDGGPGGAGSSSSTSGSGGMSASSSSASGSGGAGGSGGVGGLGGAGGSGGAGGGCPAQPGEPGSCGGNFCPPCPPLVVIATGLQQAIGGRFISGMGWSTSNLGNEKTADAPAIGLIGAKKQAVAVIHSDNAATKDKVRYASWTAMNGFGTFADLGFTTRSTPAVASSTSALHVVYHGVGVDNYYYAQFDGVTFAPTNEQVGPMGAPSLGLAMPGITVLGADPRIANPGWDNGFLYDQARVAGVWQSGTQHDPLFIVDDVPPAIAALAKGPELLIVFTRASDKQLHAITRTSNVWSAPVAITGAMSIEPVLLALPNGGAILAYRDSADMNKIKWARFDGNAWSAITDLGAVGKSRPGLAVGAGDAEAELVYVDNITGVAMHRRLQSGSFTAPSVIGGANLVGAAAVTAP